MKLVLVTVITTFFNDRSFLAMLGKLGDLDPSATQYQVTESHYLVRDTVSDASFKKHRQASTVLSEMFSPIIVCQIYQARTCFHCFREKSLLLLLAEPPFT